ncbi:MAG: hypothetical protein QOF27_1157, partial [Gaiellaceae bacterium]|nr:hypothetical protein [Gaiellaceae bacterium]
FERRAVEAARDGAEAHSGSYPRAEAHSGACD